MTEVAGIGMRAFGLLFCLSVLAFSQSPPTVNNEDLNVRALIAKFASLRNAHDGAGVASLYSEDGEWIAKNGSRVRGKQALAELWAGVTQEVQRTIQSVDSPGPYIAVVHVNAQYPDPFGVHQEVFILVKENSTWYIRV